VLIGMVIVFFYAVLGGMKGITYTQVAQYCVLIFAFMVPAIFISLLVADNPIPQLGFGGADASGTWLLDKLDGLHEELGFAQYTDGSKATIDVVAITAALMVGTAGLPHVIIRFYTVPRVRDARASAGWALFFIAILYTTAPAVGLFARLNLLETVVDRPYAEAPEWFRKWEATGLIAFNDLDGDGHMRYVGPRAVADAEDVAASGGALALGEPLRNELVIDNDIIVLANPEIARLPNWVIGLVAAGGLAAALSTAAGLLLVVSTAVSHDLCKRAFLPGITEKGELLVARLAAAVAVCFAGYLGIDPPGFVASVVAFAFGLAASSFFPAIILGIFSKRMNRYGAVSGMVVGILFTAAYIVWFKFVHPELNAPEHWLLGISPEGIGTVGMLLNLAVATVIARFTPPPSPEVQALIESIRVPRGAGPSTEITA
jgi:cation/acetate symporter